MFLKYNLRELTFSWCRKAQLGKLEDIRAVWHQITVTQTICVKYITGNGALMMNQDGPVCH